MMIIKVVWTMMMRFMAWIHIHLHRNLLQGGIPLHSLRRHKRLPSPVKSPLKKKASRRKTKSSEELPYEKFEEESKAAAQKDLDNWRQSLAESRAKRKELMKTPPKPHYIAQRELRKKSLKWRKSGMRHVSPRHYRTMNALSTSHIRRR
jgi:hypothetical protein